MSAAADLVNSLVAHDESGGIITEIRSSDGYVNATKLCQSAGRRWPKYYENQSSRDFISEFSSTIDPSVVLLKYSSGGNGERHTWIHPVIAEDLQRWCRRSGKCQYEADVCTKLACEVFGEREVKTPHGLADIVSDTEVIEVKHVSKYLHALGQVIGYSLAFPEKKTRIHLFGTKCAIEKYRSLAEEVCLATGTRVTFEETTK